MKTSNQSWQNQIRQKRSRYKGPFIYFSNHIDLHRRKQIKHNSWPGYELFHPKKEVCFWTHPSLSFQIDMVKSNQPCFKIGVSIWKLQIRADKIKSDKKGPDLKAPLYIFQITLIYIEENKTSIIPGQDMSYFIQRKMFIFEPTLRLFFKSTW